MNTAIQSPSKSERELDALHELNIVLKRAIEHFGDDARAVAYCKCVWGAVMILETANTTDMLADAVDRMLAAPTAVWDGVPTPLAER